MKLLTWNEILNIKDKKIKLIGYGSLLNENTHHEIHSYKPVIFFGFKRIYNLKIKENLKSIGYLEQYGIRKKEEIESLFKKNICALNCIATGNPNEIVNGLCIEINKKDLLDYSIRENQYDLVETNYAYICTKTGKIEKTSENAYVLVAKKEETTSSGIPFDNYHINTRNGAYNFGENFGKLFDETTYNLNGELISKH